jgi:serine/threonine protein kinase
VFACLDQKTGKKFALKFIGYEMESDQDPDFKSAVKEIVIMQTLARSNHNSILRIHDVYPCIKDDNKYLVIVMELCDCNLMELIKVI